MRWILIIVITLLALPAFGQVFYDMDTYPGATTFGNFSCSGFPNGQCWQYNADPGIHVGSISNTTTATDTTVTHDGISSRRWDITGMQGGAGWITHFSTATGATYCGNTNFVWDAWGRFASTGTNLGQYEFDIYFVPCTGTYKNNPAIMSVQCNAASTFWQVTSQVGGGHWFNTDIHCNRSSFSDLNWYHEQSYVSVDISTGNVTYWGVGFNNTFIPFTCGGSACTVFDMDTALTYPDGIMLVNYQQDNISGGASFNYSTWLDEAQMHYGTSWANMSTVQVTQTGSTAGSCTGSGAQIITPAQMNQQASWQTSLAPATPGAIGPGTTALLCGTLNFPTAGTPGLTAHGSGAVGNPWTIKFDTGAVVQSPAFSGFSNAGACPCGGGIIVVGLGNGVIDGGVNGVLTNTANGTSLTNHANSFGVYLHNTTNLEVKNLNILNIYTAIEPTELSLSACTGTGHPANHCGQYTGDIYADGSETNLKVDNNHLSNARTGFWGDFSGGNWSGFQLNNNLINDHVWSVSIADFNANANTNTTPLLYNNELTDWANWSVTGTLDPVYHEDGFFLGTSATVSWNPYIYNNYIHGPLGFPSGTSFIYCTGLPSSGGNISCTAFNNVLAMGSSAPGDPIAFDASGGTELFYNNTIDGGGSISTNEAWYVYTDTPTFSGTITFKNNIFSNFHRVVVTNGIELATHTSGWDYNQYYNLNSGDSSQAWNFAASCTNGGGGYCSFPMWKAIASTPDAHGGVSTSVPGYGANFRLQVGSLPIGTGQNLSSLCVGLLVPLCTDLGGVLRPTGTTAWDDGAYQGPVSVLPAPASSLFASLNKTKNTLTWKTSPTRGVTYSVWRDYQHGGPYHTVKTGVTGTTWTDTLWTRKAPFFYVVRADRTGGCKLNCSSIFSNEVEVVCCH